MLPGGAGGPNDGDILPWGMNTSSGTFGTPRRMYRSQQRPRGLDAEQRRVCESSGGATPLENDMKPLITTGRAQHRASPDNPENWMWWGSFGVFSAFPFTSQSTRNSTAFMATQARINGTFAGFGNILPPWPICRTIFHVTRKADADCVKTAGATTDV